MMNVLKVNRCLGSLKVLRVILLEDFPDTVSEPLLEMQVRTLLLVPLVVERGAVGRSHADALRADGDGGVHEFAVVVVEVIFQLDAISIGEHHRSVTAFVAVAEHHKTEHARVDLGFVEHPLVEKQVVVAGRGNHKGDFATYRARCRLARVVNLLVELIGTLHDAIGASGDFQMSL